MPFLIAAMILVGALCLLDLALTLAVIRRLKEHTAHLDTLLKVIEIGDHLPEVGVAVGDFTGTTADGETVTRDLLLDETLVAFFSPTCEPCREKLPAFAEYARERAGGKEQILAVVSGGSEKSPTQAAEMVEALTPVARTVVEGDQGSLAKAFHVDAFPTFCVVDSAGTVVAVEADPNRLPIATHA